MKSVVIQVMSFPKNISSSISKLVGVSLSLVMMAGSGSATSAEWWTMPDLDFANTYRSMAFSDNINEQSEVAWMLFARLNQQQNYNGRTYSAWELWPSNQDTFSAAVRKFSPENKVRTRPHLQDPKIHRLLSSTAFSAPIFDAGEEVTRNFWSYGYIMNKGLNTKAGVWNYLSTSGARVDFPIGSIETKGDWTTGAVDGAYQITDPTTGTVYSLLGLHIMAKMGPSPADPFTSEDPSWFWTTFEFMGNPGLANAESLITYPDKVSVPMAKAMLAEAGLSGTPFNNYRSMGTQIRYSDTAHPKIILGNTTMEAFAGLPNPNDPATWTSWDSSCHSCHGVTSANPTTKTFYPFPSNPFPTGVISGMDFQGFMPLDFVWSIAFHAQ